MKLLALLPNLMGPDGLVIFLFVLLFFGAKRLPELAKGLGSAVREFSKAKDEIEHEITRAPTPRIEAPRDTQPYGSPVTPSLEVETSHLAGSTTPVEVPITPVTPIIPTTEESHQRPQPPVV